MDNLELFDSNRNEYDKETLAELHNNSFEKQDEETEIPTNIIFMDSPIEFNIYIVDFQGYEVNKRFFFKEVAIYKERERSFQNVFCRSPSLSSSTYNYLVNCHHRIPYNYGTAHYQNIIQILNQADIIYCKNESKKRILQKYIKLPIINLEDQGCPRIVDLPSPETTFLCSFEEHHISPYCSLKIVQRLVQWVQTI